MFVGLHNTNDFVAFTHERNLPLGNIEATKIAEELLNIKSKHGYLTISIIFQCGDMSK